MQLFKTKASISVDIKQLNASSGEHTVNSPLTLNEVFINIGHPVLLSKALINE